MVFQSYALYPQMTVAQNIGFALKMKKMPKAEIDRRVRDAAAVLGLTNWLDRKPTQLSGGQRQRVAMGRAIVRQPERVSDGRTAVEFGRQAPGAVASRDRARPTANRRGHAVCHPRPDRGHDARPSSGGTSRRNTPAVRLARGALPEAAEHLCRGIHRLAGNESARRGSLGRTATRSFLGASALRCRATSWTLIPASRSISVKSSSWAYGQRICRPAMKTVRDRLSAATSYLVEALGAEKLVHFRLDAPVVQVEESSVTEGGRRDSREHPTGTVRVRGPRGTAVQSERGRAF